MNATQNQLQKRYLNSKLNKDVKVNNLNNNKTSNDEKVEKFNNQRIFKVLNGSKGQQQKTWIQKGIHLISSFASLVLKYTGLSYACRVIFKYAKREVCYYVGVGCLYGIGGKKDEKKPLIFFVLLVC